MPPSRRLTLQDVADAVGLSANTVSRALSGKSGVGEATRKRIHTEAERLGFVLNVHARSLVTGARMMIGLVITTPSNLFYANLISAVEKRVMDAGYSLLLLATDESTEREEAAATTALQSGVDGLIVVPVQGRTNPWSRVQRAGIPIVLVNRELDELHTDLVRTDNDLGAYAATSHVIAQGAKSVIMLEEDLPITTIRHRIEGFQRAMREKGLPSDDGNVVRVPTRRNDGGVLPWQSDEAYGVAARLIDRGRRPDAFVTGNDYFALGVYRALHERGFDVPGDVLVAGYGDYPFSAYLTPSLSTVRLPAETVGESIVELLLARLGAKDAVTPRTLIVPPELIIRESTRWSRSRRQPSAQ
jgi:LacI family transcriptional regulator